MNELCSIELLRNAVSRRLSPDEEAALHAHLDQCESCCVQLDLLAGGDAWQQETALLLRTEELDEAFPGAVGWSDADFGVEHLDPSEDANALGQIGGYDVLAIVGRGGMGVVLKAFDRELKRFVAIKVLAPHLAHSSVARKRFAREAQAAAAVVNPHVIAIHHVQPAGRLPFLIMPLLTGESLAQRLKARGPLELTEVLRIGMQAAVGLARAADDVSMSRVGVVAGTPEYMSPEQALGEVLDGRSDLFSLGCVLYEMATGVSPFRADSTFATLRRIVEGKPAAMASLNPELPPWFNRIVEQLLSKDPVQRIASASEVSFMLEACLSHLQQPGSMPLPASVMSPSQVARWSQISRRSLGVIVMFAAFVLSLFGMLLAQALVGPDAQEAPSKAAEVSGQIVAGQTQAAETQVKTALSEVIQRPPGPPFQRTQLFTAVAKGNEITVAYSLDGKLIAVANSNPTLIMLGAGRAQVADEWKPTIDVLDAATGNVVVSLKLTSADEDAVLAMTARISHIEVKALAFSPDGKSLAVGTNIGQVKLFNSQTGELIRSLDDEPAKIADPKTPENWKPLKRAIGNVTALAFSPDGGTLAICGGSFADFAERFDALERLGFRLTGPGRLKLWDFQTGKLKYDLAGHNDFATAVAFSPDGRWLASAGRWMNKDDFGNGVHLWDAKAGNQIRSYRTTADGGVRAMAFSPDSKFLAIGTQRFKDDDPKENSSGGVMLVHVSSGIEEWLVSVPGWAIPMSFFPDGKSLAVLCGGKSIRFLDTGTGAVKQEIRGPDPEDGRWQDFSIGVKGGTLVIGGVDKGRNGNVEVWTTKADEPKTKQAVSSAPITTPDAQAEAIRRYYPGMLADRLACSADGKLIAASNGQPTTTIASGQGTKVADSWRPEVKILDALTGKTVTSLKLSTAEEDAILAATDKFSHFEVTALAFSPEGHVIAVGNSIGQVKLFDARTGALVRALDDEKGKFTEKISPVSWKPLSRVMGSIASLAFSPDGATLASCGNSFDDIASMFDGRGRLGELSSGPGRLKIWDATTGALKHDLDGHSHVSAVAFSPDGSLLASAGSWLTAHQHGTGVLIWNSQAGERLCSVSVKANGGTHAVIFAPNSKQIAIASRSFNKENDTSSTTVSVLYVLSGVMDWSRSFPSSVKPIAYQPDGKVFLQVHSSESLRFINAQTGAIVSIIDSTDAAKGGRWNDVVMTPNGHLHVISGLDAQKRGFVEVWTLGSESAKDAEKPGGR
jgi:WD40 repeat protein